MSSTDELEVLLNKLENGSLEEQIQTQWHFSEGDEAAVPRLIELLKNPEKRNIWWLVANILGRIGDKRAVEPLTEILNSSRSFAGIGARERAAWALGILKDQRAVDALLEALRHREYHTDETGNTYEQPDEETIEMVEWALAEIGDLRALEPIVQRILEDYYQDASILKKWGEPALKLLLDELNNSDEIKRGYAASLLGEFGDLRAVEPLIEILQHDPSPHARHKAAYALGLLNDLRAYDTLIRALNDPYDRARASAADGLGRLKDRRAVDALKRATQDEEPNVQWAAKRALDLIENERSGRRSDNSHDFYNM